MKQKNIISISVNFKKILSSNDDKQVETNVNDKNLKGFISVVKETIEKLILTIR